MLKGNYFWSRAVILISFLFLLTSLQYAQQNKKTTIKGNKSQQEHIVPGWNKKVRVSPKAFETQTIGLTDITISYSRPGVKGRKIWGGLVPYNKVWRAGANEATKFTFSTDVWIEGKKFPAGSYSFFIIPRQNKDWTIIFNKVADQWGAFEYNEAEDFARFNVKPQTVNLQEWLTYSFSNLKVNNKGNNSAVISMVWEKIKIPFTIVTQVD